jgi:hypothetical protein
MPEPIFMKLGMYIMALEPISTTYFINPSHQSVSVICIPLSLLGNGSVKNVTAATNTRNNRRTADHVVFCAFRIVSKENRRLVLPITSCFIIEFCKRELGLLWQKQLEPRKAGWGEGLGVPDRVRTVRCLPSSTSPGNDVLTTCHRRRRRERDDPTQFYVMLYTRTFTISESCLLQRSRNGKLQIWACSLHHACCPYVVMSRLVNGLTGSREIWYFRVVFNFICTSRCWPRSDTSSGHFYGHVWSSLRLESPSICRSKNCFDQTC